MFSFYLFVFSSFLFFHRYDYLHPLIHPLTYHLSMLYLTTHLHLRRTAALEHVYVISPGRYDTNRPRMEPVRGMELLWQPSVVEVYLLLLNDASNPETLEAAAGAIQNLAACDWQVRQPKEPV